jgi:signal peptidase II
MSDAQSPEVSLMSPSKWIWGPQSGFGIGMALAALLADQVTKWLMLAVYRIQDLGRVRVTPFLDLVYVRNLGISYGLLPSETRRAQWLLAAFALASAVALTVWLARGGGGRLWAASVGLIIGGAIGNAIDRLHLGGVADFFSLHAFGFYWYVFNIADVAIVAGVIGLLYESLWASRNDASNTA